MNKEQLKTLIKFLQCKQAIFANKVADKLSLGICSDEYLDRLTISSYLLEVFYRYQAFATSITNSQTLVFSTETDEIVTFELFVGDISLGIYNDVGSINLINAYFLNYINVNTNTTGYYAEIVEDTLIIYSSLEGETYEDSILLVFDTLETLEFTSVSNEDNLSEILNKINCLSVCNLSNIKDKFLQTIKL